MFTNGKFSKKDNVATKTELKVVQTKVESVQTTVESMHTTVESVQTDVDALKAADHFIKVDVLPEAATADKKAIYIVPVTDGSEGDYYTEHIVVDGAWESIGSTKADLTGYAKVETLTPTEEAPAIAKVSGASTFFVMPVDVVIAEGQTKTINIMTATNEPLA